jgi:hypothetical protein
MMDFAGCVAAPWSYEKKYLASPYFYETYSDNTDIPNKDVMELRMSIRVLRDDMLAAQMLWSAPHLPQG